MDIRGDRTVAIHAARLAERATVSRGIPRRLADHARHVTAARFAGTCSEPLSEAAQRRMAAYFDGVVRHRVFQVTDPDTLAFRHRLVEASIEEDLRTALGAGAVRPGAPMLCEPLPLGV
jgi:hypothetical protein